MVFVRNGHIGCQASGGKDAAQLNQCSILLGQQITAPTQATKSSSECGIAMRKIGMKLSHLGNILGFFFGSIIAVDVYVNSFETF